MKVVVDTNVLIAAFLTSGASRDVVEEILARKSCILSPYILAEFRKNLLSKKFGFPTKLVDEFCGYLTHYSVVVEEDRRLVVEFTDPTDCKILALCQTVKADFLVTGDHELLRLGQIGYTKIIRPSEFWSAL